MTLLCATPKIRDDKICALEQHHRGAPSMASIDRDTRSSTVVAASAQAADRRDPGFSIDAVARIAPFAAYIALLALTPLISDSGHGHASGWQAWLPAARGLVAGALLLLFWSRYSELQGPRIARGKHLAIACALGVAVYALWIVLDAPWMVIGSPTSPASMSTDYGTDALAVTSARLLGLVVVVPIMDELFWRSFVMRWLTRHHFLGVDPRTVSRFAFWSTAALFALEHNQWLAGLIAGVVFNWLYMRTRSLGVAVLAHAVANACLGFHILHFDRWDLW
jgi:CAAX prenyl protease-like protein